MDAINRSAVIVMPAQPFLDWLHRADPTSAALSLEDLRREPTIYLLPEYNIEQEARGYLREYCSQIFEEQLDGCTGCFSLAGRSNLRQLQPLV